ALPAAGLADQPECLAVVDVERDPVDGVDDPGLGAEVNLQITDRGNQGDGRTAVVERREGRGGHRPSIFGSRTSLRPSPNRLKERDHRNTISPGNVEAHHRPVEIPTWPSLTSTPHSASPASDRPMKLRVAAV